MNWNIVLYIGLAFYVLIFILFITNEMDKRKKDREQWLSNQLSKSFEKGKNANTNETN
jgi:hypothetical protein